MHQPPAEDGPQPSPHTPPKGRTLRRAPVPRAAGILGGEHHTLPAEAIGHDTLLDGNRQGDVQTESSNHRGHKCAGRESAPAAMQRTD